MSDSRTVGEAIENSGEGMREAWCMLEELTDELTFIVEAKPTALDRIIQYKMERE